MRIHRLLPIAAIALLLTVSTAPAQDPLKVGPDVYKLKLENERVRVLEVTFAPGAKIGMHSHPDHVAVALTPGKLRIMAKGGKPQELDLKSGDPVWILAESHQAENVGKTEVKLVVVELKK